MTPPPRLSISGMPYLAEQKMTLGVYVHDTVPYRFVQILRRSVALRRLYADVIEENIDAAKRCDGLLDDVARLGGARDVRLNECDFACQRATAVCEPSLPRHDRYLRPQRDSPRGRRQERIASPMPCAPPETMTTLGEGMFARNYARVRFLVDIRPTRGRATTFSSRSELGTPGKCTSG